MRRPNYRFERAERDRNKQARKEEKLKRLQERAAQRSDLSEPAQAAEPPDTADRRTE
jgi:hypothetical protein